MKYLLITAKEENEPNIGILILNEDGNYPKDELKIALDAHFDSDIEIIDTKKLCQNPISIKVNCVDRDNQNYKFNVELNQTWLY